jgi:hypothetical protein
MRYSAASLLFLSFLMLGLPYAACGQAPAFTTCIGDIGSCAPGVSSINLGPATVGGGSFVAVKITNSGSATLTINYSFSSPVFAFGLFNQTLPPNPLVIDPGASVQTFIEFLPASTGLQSGQFVSNDNAPGSPHVIPLSGTGVTVASNDFAIMLDPAGPSMFTLKQGSTTTFPVYVLEGPQQNNPSAAGGAQCSGGPAGSTCTLDPNFFPAALASQVKINVSVTVPAKTGLLHGPPFIWWAVALVPGLVLLVCRRRRPGNFAAALTVSLLALAISCGGGSTAAPPIVITAAVNGGAPHILTVPVSGQ